MSFVGILPYQARRIAQAAVDEDLGRGDLTTSALFDGELGTAVLLAREPLVIAGLPLAQAVFQLLDPSCRFTALVVDGTACTGPRQPVARVEGKVASLLTGERVALNLLQHASGIATLTRHLVNSMGNGRRPRLSDTRKTRPGLRLVEKYAVRAGGGHNHRMGLDDGIMLKDNHIAAAGGVAIAVERVRARAHHLVRIEVEAETADEARQAAEAGADVVMLDNFSPDEMKPLVAELHRDFPRLVVEASGGISEETLPAYAETGVDVISCGALIHQAKWVDLSMDLLGAAE